MFIIDNIFSLDIVGIKSKSNDIHHTNIKETIKIQKNKNKSENIKYIIAKISFISNILNSGGDNFISQVSIN